MAKEPRLRYESAAELAADLRRFLADEPLVAGPPSTAYRARKFIRRHKALVYGTLTAFAGTVLGLAQALDAKAEAEETAARALSQ